MLYIFRIIHWTKYQESGNLNIAETRGTVAETQRLTHISVSGYVTVSHVSVAAFSTEPEHFFSRFRQISVSGITYFRNRYHVNKLRKGEITFGNKFVSFSSFGGNVGVTVRLRVFFFLFPPVSVALTMSMSLKNYLHTQMLIFLVVNTCKFNLHEFCHSIILRAGFISRLQAVSICTQAAKTRTII